MDFNKVIIVGRVTANPELRTTPGGQAVTTIGVATNRVWTDKSGAKQEEVEFHNVVLWGRQAEIASQFLVKGATVLIEGRLRTRSWTDKQGAQHRTTEIMSERMQLGPRPQGAQHSQGSFGSAQDKSGGQTFGAKPAAQDGEKEFPVKEEEIPTINLEEEDMKPLDDLPF